MLALITSIIAAQSLVNGRFAAAIDLTEYSSKEEFYEACKELHSDEEDAEFMFQDGSPQRLGKYS